jgi:hypothetical protein
VQPANQRTSATLLRLCANALDVAWIQRHEVWRRSFRCSASLMLVLFIEVFRKVQSPVFTRLRPLSSDEAASETDFRRATLAHLLFHLLSLRSYILNNKCGNIIIDCGWRLLRFSACEARSGRVRRSCDLRLAFARPILTFALVHCDEVYLKRRTLYFIYNECSIHHYYLLAIPCWPS